LKLKLQTPSSSYASTEKQAMAERLLKLSDWVDEPNNESHKRAPIACCSCPTNSVISARRHCFSHSFAWSGPLFSTRGDLWRKTKSPAGKFRG